MCLVYAELNVPITKQTLIIVHIRMDSAKWCVCESYYAERWSMPPTCLVYQYLNIRCIIDWYLLCTSNSMVLVIFSYIVLMMQYNRAYKKAVDPLLCLASTCFITFGSNGDLDKDQQALCLYDTRA